MISNNFINLVEGMINSEKDLNLSISIIFNLFFIKIRKWEQSKKINIFRLFKTSDS